MKTSFLLSILLGLAPAAAQAQTLYVSNYRGDAAGNGTIRAYDLVTGTDLGVFGHPLHAPIGLAVDALGNVYAGRSAYRTVERFSAVGADLGTFAVTGLAGPYGLAFDAAGNLYAAMANSGAVLKFDPAGNSLGVFTYAPGPVALAFDAAGNLYTGGWLENVIRRFAPDGTPLGIFASMFPGEAPWGLAFDVAGNLYASDWNNDAVRRFDSSGANLGVFARSGLDDPWGLAFDGNGNLYVASQGNSTIHRFGPDGADLGVFAGPDGLDEPLCLAISVVVPEPDALAGAVVFAAVAVLLALRRRSP